MRKTADMKAKVAASKLANEYLKTAQFDVAFTAYMDNDGAMTIGFRGSATDVVALLAYSLYDAANKMHLSAQTVMDAFKRDYEWWVNHEQGAIMRELVAARKGE